MGDIVQLHTWADQETLTHTDLNAEFQQLINTVNALGNDNWAAAGVDNLDGTKIDLGTNTTFLGEHTAAGVHTAFAGNNMDNCWMKRNASSPDDTIDIHFDRINVYTSDTLTTRTRTLYQDTGATTLSPDITGAAGANSIDTGSVANSTTYYIWVIYNPTTTTAAGLFSLSATIASLTLPSGYTYAKLVGKVATNSSGDFKTPRPIAGATQGTVYKPEWCRMERGSYTSQNNSGQSITGLGFMPSAVIVQRLTDGYAGVLGSYDMGGYSLTFAGASIANGIVSLDADGFSVGTHNNVDGGAVGTVTYVWMAWRAEIEVDS